MSKIALITGGTTGLGAGICAQLHCDGYQVIANYLPALEADAKAWQQQVQSEGMHCEIAAADVSDASQCKTMVDGLLKEFSRIDVLVNNAGIIRDSSIAKMDAEKWNAVINTNLNSLFNMCKPVIASMQEHGFGRIVNMSSVNAQRGQFGQTNYCAAKAGVHGFTKALAKETARFGITVNTVSPGLIATSMVESIPKEIMDELVQQIPVGRVGLPEDIARAVRFLVDDNTSYITGHELEVNGGFFMH
ncbi:UNVERIFIED_CONTAM: hypothetical protein GTU68_010501 [Idotea baltica]|nr:hypothetical protein [Idotea baltica]